MINGLSNPTIYQVGMGDDTAFLLSYAEASEFVSLTRFVRGPIANLPSSPIAVKNYYKLTIPAGVEYFAWLRSPGDTTGSVGALGFNNIGNPGRVFQFFAPSDGSFRGLIYPALWVHQDIFK